MIQSRRKAVLYISGLLAFGLLCLLWYGFFRSQSSVNTSGVTTDAISGETYDRRQISSDRGPNPNAPYYLGFDSLTRYGVSDDDVAYVRDVIANYVLYEVGANYAKVSLVNSTFRGPIIQGTASTYSFDFTVNGKNRTTVKWSSDIVEQSIKVSLVDSVTNKRYDKSFKLNPL